MHAWQLRWFTINSTQISSIPDRTNSEYQQIVYPPFATFEVDESHLLLKINTGGTRRDCEYEVHFSFFLLNELSL